VIQLYDKMKSGLQFLIHKIKSYWRLFFCKSPVLRNATGIGLIIFSLFYFVRFDTPLNFQFSEAGSEFHFIQDSDLEDLYSITAALELFDTAPIFIPTKWNYGSTVLPKKRVSSDAEFVSFEPQVDLEVSVNLNLMQLNTESVDKGILYENTFFDPRLLALFIPTMEESEKNFLNNRILRVEIIESYDAAEFSKGAIIDYVYELNENPSLSNLDPMIIFLRNKNALASNPKVYQSSLSEPFDEQILEWLNKPRHIALLPKGFLKLTFYPN